MSFNVIMETITSLLGTIAVMVVLAYAINHTKLFLQTKKSNKDLRNIILLGLLGGIFCIYASFSAVEFNGALVNVRDVGSLLAGSLGGPVAGLIAGLIGGVSRFFMGGPTALACSLSTLLAGLFSGILSLIFKKRLIKISNAFIMGAAMEIIHMGLALLLTKPFEQAYSIVSVVGIPMIVINSLGLGLMFYVFKKADK